MAIINTIELEKNLRWTEFYVAEDNPNEGDQMAVTGGKRVNTTSLLFVPQKCQKVGEVAAEQSMYIHVKLLILFYSC